MEIIIKLTYLLLSYIGLLRQACI